MAPSNPALFVWLLAALHLIGLVSMFLARVPHSHSVHRPCQRLFLACLFFVGLATMFTICVQSNCWVWSGTTFSVMAVGATFDYGPAARAPGF